VRLTDRLTIIRSAFLVVGESVKGKEEKGC
jgi:hypothetical protein